MRGRDGHFTVKMDKTLTPKQGEQINSLSLCHTLTFVKHLYVTLKWYKLIFLSTYFSKLEIKDHDWIMSLMENHWKKKELTECLKVVDLKLKP